MLFFSCNPIESTPKGPGAPIKVKHAREFIINYTLRIKSLIVRTEGDADPLRVYENKEAPAWVFNKKEFMEYISNIKEDNVAVIFGVGPRKWADDNSNVIDKTPVVHVIIAGASKAKESDGDEYTLPSLSVSRDDDEIYGYEHGSACCNTLECIEKLTGGEKVSFL